MRLLHPLRILHVARERVLVASVTIADGHKIEVVRVQGEDFRVDEKEAERITAHLISVLRHAYEIEISGDEEARWFDTASAIETWRTT